MNTDTNKETTPVTLQPGLTVKVHQKIRETNTKGEEKERIQIFEGMVIGVKKPNSREGTFTVRKDSAGVGVEKVFPINSPLIVKIESVKKAKVKRAKLYFTRHSAKRLKEKKVA
jgi:large subunit ribosomal protein L19